MPDKPHLHGNIELKRLTRSLIVPKCELRFHLVVQQSTWLLNHWANLLGFVVMEDWSLIPPDKCFYTFQSLPLRFFAFVVSAWLSQPSHTHTHIQYTCAPTAWTSHSDKHQRWWIRCAEIVTQQHQNQCTIVVNGGLLRGLWLILKDSSLCVYTFELCGKTLEENS